MLIFLVKLIPVLIPVQEITFKCDFMQKKNGFKTTQKRKIKTVKSGNNLSTNDLDIYLKIINYSLLLRDLPEKMKKSRFKNNQEISKINIFLLKSLLKSV